MVLSVLTALGLSQEYGLQQLMDIALENNNDVQSARLSLKGTSAYQKGSFSGFLPSASLSLSRDLNDPEEIGITDEFGQPVLNDDGTQKVWKADTYYSRLSIHQPIFNGGQNWYNNRSVANSIGQAELNLKSTEEQVLYAVKVAYYDYLSFIELQEVADLSMELADRQMELVQQQYDLQAVSQTDLLKARVRRGQAQASVLQARQNVTSAYNSLIRVLGFEPGTQLAVLKEEVHLEPELSIELARDILLEENSSLQFAKSQVRSATLSYRSQMGVFMPDVSVGAYYETTGDDVQNTVTDLADQKVSASLTLSMPLFTGLSNLSRLQAQKYEVKVAEKDYNRTRAALITELENTLLALSTLADLVPINEEIIGSAELDVRLAEEKYNLGSNTILDVLNAQVSLIQAKSDLVSVKYSAKKTEAALAVLLGQ